MQSIQFKAALCAAASIVAVHSFADGIHAKPPRDAQAAAATSRAAVRAELQEAQRDGLTVALGNSYTGTTTTASQPGLTRAQVHAEAANAGGARVSQDALYSH